METCVIVDLETTGLNAKDDRIIEIGLIEFSVDANMQPAIVSTYGALQDPGMIITPEITKITGITNEQVSGKKINWQIVQDIFDKSAIVIAHNMEFDRGFLRESGCLKLDKTHWGCSAKHIDWAGHGFKTRALNYLAADHGFVNPFAHRAVFDCATTFRLITPYIKELIEMSYEKEIRVIATGSPFESKDILKDNGYRWDVPNRVWIKTVFNSKIEQERKFLQDSVYKGKSKHIEEIITG